MNQPRIIWRPNEVPPEAWEAMSREEQITWCKNRAVPPAGSSRTLFDIPAMYQQGRITLHECFGLVCRYATEETLPSFLETCPVEIRSMIDRQLCVYGNDEAAWPRSFQIATYFPWVSAEEIQDLEEARQQAEWDSIRRSKTIWPQE